MTRKFILMLGISLPAFFVVFAQPSIAGCNPKCAKGEVCRYEAAGGKFYCQKKKSSSGSLHKPANADSKGTIQMK